MKTFQEFLQEKWVSFIKKTTTSYPIYENPGSRDIIELKKSGLEYDLVRFLAVKSTKKLYVWSGMHMIHEEVITKLFKDEIINRNIKPDNLDYCLCGECYLKAGRLTFDGNKGTDTYWGIIIFSLLNKLINIPSLSPYDDFDDLARNLPKIINTYNFVGSYIDEYETQSSPAITLELYNKL